MNVLVMVPTRGNKAACERLLESHQENTDFADIVFILDPDDSGTYEDVDWKGTSAGVMSPRGTPAQKLNRTAAAFVDDYDILMFVRDECIFRTPHWDTILAEKFGKIGNTGMIYPDILKRNEIPDVMAISSNLVEIMGYFANPLLADSFLGNTWMELGKRSGLIYFCPSVVIEDCREPGKRGIWADSDVRAFQEWHSTLASTQVSQLRREFNPDVQWVLDII